MKYRGCVGVFVLLTVYGCVSAEYVEQQMRQLRSELHSEIRNETGSLSDSLKKNIQNVDRENKEEIGNLKSSVSEQMNELKENQKKYAIETDKTLVDHQKQIFQNKAVTDDTMKRVYLLESIVTAKSAVQKEGYVTFVSDDSVSISLGSANGVRVGAHFGVYNETGKIGMLTIDTVEVNSSKGFVMNREKAISVGDRVEKTR